MHITNVNVTPVTTHPKIAGRGTVTFDNVMDVKVTIWKTTKGGLYVGLPSQDSGKKDPDNPNKNIYYSQVFLKTDEARKNLQETVSTALQAKMNGESNSSPNPSTTSFEDDDAPF